jgi:nicotinamidase-related amidase
MEQDPTPGLPGDDASLRPSETVLVMVDFINPMHFQGAQALLPGAMEAARATARLKRRLSREGVTVVYANDNYGIWRSDFKELLARCQALPGLRGKIACMLEPQPCDLTILKPLHSAFHGTPLEHLLRQMQTRNVVVVGLSTDMCVHLTATDAYMRGFKVWVPSNCTAAENPARKAAALYQLAHCFSCVTRKA